MLYTLYSSSPKRNALKVSVSHLKIKYLLISWIGKGITVNYELTPFELLCGELQLQSKSQYYYWVKNLASSHATDNKLTKCSIACVCVVAVTRALLALVEWMMVST